MLIERLFILFVILSLFTTIPICLMCLFHKYLCVDGKARVDKILEQEKIEEIARRAKARQALDLSKQEVPLELSAEVDHPESAAEVDHPESAARVDPPISSHAGAVESDSEPEDQDS